NAFTYPVTASGRPWADQVVIDKSVIVESHLALALRRPLARAAHDRPFPGDPMRLLRLPRVVLILAALGPGCGGGSSPSTPATPTTTTTPAPPAATADVVISILGNQGGMS